MKWRMLGIASLFLVAILAGAYFAGFLPSQGNSPCLLSQVGSIPLPNLVGRIDHMSFDPRRQNLYVAALGNNTLDVVSVSSKKLERVIGGFSEPQGVLYLPTSDVVYVSNAGNGIVNVLNASSLHHLANISLGSDSDNLRYDPRLNKVYVGYGQGAIAAIDPTNQRIVGKVQLSGHPEAFQFESGSALMFVNVASTGYVAVANTSTYSVIDRWPLVGASGNYPLALDEAHQRLFIGTRSPPQLNVLDSRTGRALATLGLPQDPDDIYYDSSNGCIYVSSGSGNVTIISGIDPSHYSLAAQIVTSPNARTSLLVVDQGLYFVAASSSGDSQARILVYRTA